MDKRILLLEKKILSEIQSPPKIETLAAYINVSPSRLRQIFRTETGMPYREYLRHLQLKHACNLLISTFMSVKEICAASGFNSQSYFTRTFKKSYTLAPKKFREINHRELKNL